MSSKTEILIGSIKKGITIEREGKEFYTDASGKIGDQQGKDTLKFLAKEEEGHIRFLENLLDIVVLGKDGELPRIVAGYEGHLTRPGIFPEKEEYLTKIRVQKDDKEVLKEARKVEERSIAFYQDAIDAVSDEGHKSVFLLLRDWEKKHLDWIDFMGESMELYGYWTGLQGYFANE